MSDDASGPTPAGWYPDGTGARRWWDGQQWTAHTQPAEGAAPAAGAAAGDAAGDGVAPTAHLPVQDAGQPGGYDATSGQPLGGGRPGDAGAPAAPSWGAPAGPGGPPSGPGYGTDPGGPTPPGKGKGPLVAVIAAVVAVVLVAAFATWFFGFRDSDDEARDDDTGSDGTSSAESSGGSQSEGTGDPDDPESEESDDPESDEPAPDAPSEDPDEVALTFLEAIGEGDCATLESMVSSSAGDIGFDDLCADPAVFQEFAGEYTFEFDIAEVDERDDEATVDYEVVSTYNGTDGPEASSGPDEDDGTIELVVEDGEWKVQTFE